MSNESDFREDDAILAMLDDPADIEAYHNLMVHAHQLGLSAADFIRQEPKRTSRKRVRKLCLQNQKRTLRMIFSSVLKGLWDRPVNDRDNVSVHALYGPQPVPEKTHTNGQSKRNDRE